MLTALAPSGTAHAAPRQAPAQSDRGIPSLDGLRALSIAGVCASHIVRSGAVPGWARSVLEPLGPSGVRVFFVISGYLITTLLLRDVEAFSRVRLGRFYFRRAMRIFPAFYVYLGVIALLVAAGYIPATGRAWPAWMYVSNVFITNDWYNLHSWSLSVEEQFYLAWPVALTLLGRQRASGVAVGACIIMPFVRLLAAAHARSAWAGGLYAFDFLAAGCLLALAPAWLRPAWSWAARRGAAIYATFVTVTVAGAVLAVPNRWASAIRLGVLDSVEMVTLAAGLAWCLTNRTSRVGRLLNSRVARVIGVGSYSIYLWQQLFFSSEHLRDYSQLGAIAGTAVAAAMSYLLVERPSLALRGWLERFWADRTLPANAGAPPMPVARSFAPVPQE